MKPFIEFVVQDDHNHSSYEAQLGCYSRYVNNCAKDGDADAVSFKIFDLRAEYDEAIIKRLALNGYSSAARIIDNNFENVTQDVIGDEIETAGPASKKVKLGSGAAVRNGRSKSSKTASGSHPGLTISTAGQHRLRYEDFDETKFMKLKSGRVVEKVLMDANLTEEATFKTRSFVIDFNCDYTRSLFTHQEWQELSELNDFVLPKLPDTLVRYIVQLGKALESLDLGTMMNVEMPTHNDVCDLVETTFRSWRRLYKKSPSPFMCPDLSEVWWARRSWPILLELLEEMEGIFQVDGEKAGLDSSRRLNQDRDFDVAGDLPRKKVGRKLDMITRDEVSQHDWMIVERQKKWDPTSTKFLRESGQDLLRETHTILSHRVHECERKNVGFRKVARFFSIYSGDKGFFSFEMRPAHTGYVSFYHRYDPYVLPVSPKTSAPHVQSVVHILQIRSAMMKTISAYQQPPPENDQECNKDLSWVYESSHVKYPSFSPIVSAGCSPVISSAQGNPEEIAKMNNL